MKHKHYDMIVAKAANMDLVVFCKNAVDEWIYQEYAETDVKFSETGFGYFLCLPQHKEACLHWLNGGGVQQKPVDDEGCGWVTCADVNKVTWMSWTSFMKDELEFRIKPKKEKRWIGVYGNHVTDGMYPTKDLCERCVNRSDKFKHTAPEGWQFIEIEVEV